MTKLKKNCTETEWAVYLQRQREYNAKYLARPEKREAMNAARRRQYARDERNPARKTVLDAKRREYRARPERQAFEKQRNASPERKAASAARHRARAYGLGPDAHAALLAHQQNACGVCKRQFGETVESQHVDHCHDSGRVRGLLCARCNSFEGFLRKLGISGFEYAARLSAYLANPPNEGVTE